MPSTLTTTVQASSRLDLPKQAAASYDGDRFFWSYTEEPHRTRRQAIIKAHPGVPILIRAFLAATPANASFYR